MEPSGSAWIPPTSTFCSSLTSICLDLPLGDSLDGPWMPLDWGRSRPWSCRRLLEGWDVSCHCHSTGDTGSEVERSRCTQTGAGFPLLGNLQRLSCLEFGLWAFQTVDSHPAKISLCKGCAQQMSEPSRSTSSKFPPCQDSRMDPPKGKMPRG